MRASTWATARLFKRGHGVAARVDGVQEALGLVDRRDGAVREFLELEVDRRAFADGEILGGSDEGAIAADAASVDDRVLDLIVALGIGELLQLRRLPHRAGGDDVELAALYSNCSLTGSSSQVGMVVALRLRCVFGRETASIALRAAGSLR